MTCGILSGQYKHYPIEKKSPPPKFPHSICMDGERGELYFLYLLKQNGFAKCYCYQNYRSHHQRCAIPKINCDMANEPPPLSFFYP